MKGIPVLGTLALALLVGLAPWPGRAAAPFVTSESGIVAWSKGSAEAMDAAGKADKAWARLSAILARIVPPKFPDREFGLDSFGAVGDGVKDCTEAFRQAIAACTRSGGGRVVVPPGTFLTGPIHLKSCVDLHLRSGATIRFTTNLAAYLPVVFTRYECTELMNFSPPIYAFEQTNIAVTGEGTLDAQGQFWHAWGRGAKGDVKQLMDMGKKGVPVAQRVFGEGHHLRPNFIQPVRCRNVLIQGVKITNSPMWTIAPAYCRNVTIQGVTVDTDGPNTDGCDPDSCAEVWIKDCKFSTGDDCIAVKSGRDEDGRRVNIPSEDIVIQNCHFAGGHGGVTMGSETSGGIRNLFAERCVFDSRDLSMALRFKTNPARGGYIENIYVRDCDVKTAQFGIHMTLRYGLGSAGSRNHPPAMRNIDIRNSTFAHLTRQPIVIEGYAATNRITDVTIANCTFAPGRHPEVVVTNAARINLINVTGVTLP